MNNYNQNYNINNQMNNYNRHNMPNYNQNINEYGRVNTPTYAHQNNNFNNAINNNNRFDPYNKAMEHASNSKELYLQNDSNDENDDNLSMKAILSIGFFIIAIFAVALIVTVTKSNTSTTKEDVASASKSTTEMVSAKSNTADSPSDTGMFSETNAEEDIINDDVPSDDVPSEEVGTETDSNQENKTSASPTPKPTANASKSKQNKATTTPTAKSSSINKSNNNTSQRPNNSATNDSNTQNTSPTRQPTQAPSPSPTNSVQTVYNNVNKITNLHYDVPGTLYTTITGTPGAIYEGTLRYTDPSTGQTLRKFWRVRLSSSTSSPITLSLVSNVTDYSFVLEKMTYPGEANVQIAYSVYFNHVR